MFITFFWGLMSYAGGPNTQMGSNPVRSYAGEFSGNSTITLTTVPTTEDYVITDILFTSQNYTCTGVYTLQNASGDILGAFRMQARSDTYDYATSTAIVQHSFRAGILVPAGTVLSLVHTTTCDTSYVLSGFLVKP